MAFGTLVLTAFAAATVVALPFWPYSRRWGFGPSMVTGVALLVLAGLIFFERYF
jgi:Protein of unknown function (DUF3309)